MRKTRNACRDFRKYGVHHAFVVCSDERKQSLTRERFMAFAIEGHVERAIWRHVSDDLMIGR